MDMRLELVPLLSTDVDRSKAFYVDRAGFHLAGLTSRRSTTWAVASGTPTSAIPTATPGPCSRSPGSVVTGSQP